MTTRDRPVVLVTGGAGFIGSALSHRLQGSGADVVVLDNLHPQIHPDRTRPQELAPDADLIVGDVTELEPWSLLEERAPDVVVHLAAETGTGQSLTEATRHGSVNVVGTTRLIDALSHRGITPKHMILASSRAVYGEGRWRTGRGEVFYPGPRDHAQLAASQWACPGPDGSAATGLPSSAASTIPAPTSVYGATKLAQEHVLRAWCVANGTKLSVLRLQNVYGPGQSLTNSYTGIVTLFSRIARERGQVELYEDGEVVRDFVYIDDVADALHAAYLAPPQAGHRVLDVGTGTATTIRELAQKLADYHGAPTPEVSGRFRDGDVRHAACDITDTLATLDWAPRWTLERGLIALQDWIAARSSSSVA